LDGHEDRRVSRLSWVLIHRRPIPAGLVVMHLCDERECYEPTHLALGDAAANHRDMREKGRQKNLVVPRLFGDDNGARKHPETRQGTRNGRAKLSEVQARAVRVLMQTRQLTPQQVAEAFGISKAQANRIAQGKQWLCLQRVAP